MSAETCPCCGQSVDPLDILIDTGRGTIIHEGKTARLTPSEMIVFRKVLDRYPEVATKDQLWSAVCDAPRADRSRPPEPKIVDVFLVKIRRKLDPLGLVITTVWGIGYALEIADPAKAKELKQRSFADTRSRRYKADDADRMNVVRLHGQGVPLTQIATRLRMTYRAVADALDTLKDAGRASPDGIASADDQVVALRSTSSALRSAS